MANACGTWAGWLLGHSDAVALCFLLVSPRISQAGVTWLVGFAENTDMCIVGDFPRLIASASIAGSRPQGQQHTAWSLGLYTGK